MRRLSIPTAVSEMTRRAYHDGFDALETDDQREIYQSLLDQRLHLRFGRLDDRPDDPREQSRYDAQTMIAAARQLEFALSEIYEEEFPELPVANGEIFDFDTSIPEGADTFYYYLYSGRAAARFTSAYAEGEAPLASIEGAEVQGRTEGLEGAYGWHVREMRRAQYAGIPLQTMLATHEKRAHLEKAQRTFLFGREDLGLPGVMKHPNINIIDAPADGTGGSARWSAKTFVQVVRDCRLLIHTSRRVSHGMRRTTDVLFPDDTMQMLESTFLDTGNATNITWLEALRKLFPGVNFRVLLECGASYSGGELTTDCALAYVRNRKILRIAYPKVFEQHAPEVRGLKTIVHCESTIGGAVLVEPQTVTRLDGIGQS